jgi:hypothetical protein
VLIGGRNPGQEAQKGPGKKTQQLCRKWRRKFLKEVAYFTVMINTQGQRQNLIYILVYPSAESCTDVL